MTPLYAFVGGAIGVYFAMLYAIGLFRWPSFRRWRRRIARRRFLSRKLLQKEAENRMLGRALGESGRDLQGAHADLDTYEALAKKQRVKIRDQALLIIALRGELGATRGKRPRCKVVSS